MHRNQRRLGERGLAVLEGIFWVGAIGGVLATAGYVYASQQKPGLTATEQAYVIAVATQRADNYLRAVATQRAAPAEAPAAPAAAPAAAAEEVVSAPPPTAVPQRPVVVQPPVVAPPPVPPAAPPAPPAPPPPAPPAPPPPAPPPPPPPSTKSTLAMCVGYMQHLTTDGLAQCQQIAAGADTKLGGCVAAVISGTSTSDAGKTACLQAALATSDGTLQDCLLGLSGQSYYGGTSCGLYYRTH